MRLLTFEFSSNAPIENRLRVLLLDALKAAAVYPVSQIAKFCNLRLLFCVNSMEVGAH